MSPERLQQQKRNAKKGIIDLADQNLTVLPQPQQSGFMPKILLAGDNFLSRLPKDMSFWSTIEELRIENNRFTKVPESLSTMGRLVSLDISRNPFAKFGSCDALPAIPRLQTLHIGGCGLKSVPPALTSAHSITKLDLTGSHEIDLSTANLQVMPRLRTLVIADCGLRGPMPHGVKQCAHLQTLDVSQNPHLELGDPKAFGTAGGTVTELKCLAMDWRAVPRGVCMLKALKTLRLGGNPLESVEGIGFLLELTALDLSKCDLTQLPPGLEEAERLEELNISDNSLSSLDGLADAVPGLKTLTFAGCPWVQFSTQYHPFWSALRRCQGLVAVSWTEAWAEVDFPATAIAQKQHHAPPASDKSGLGGPLSASTSQASAPQRGATTTTTTATTQQPSTARTPAPNPLSLQPTTATSILSPPAFPIQLCTLPSLRKVNGVALEALRHFTPNTNQNLLHIINSSLNEQNSPVVADMWFNRDVIPNFLNCLDQLVAMESIIKMNFPCVYARYLLFLVQQCDNRSATPIRRSGPSAGVRKALLPPLDVAAVHFAHMLEIDSYSRLCSALSNGDHRVIPCRYRELFTAAEGVTDSPHESGSRPRWNNFLHAACEDSHLRQVLDYDFLAPPPVTSGSHRDRRPTVGVSSSPEDLAMTMLELDLDGRRVEELLPSKLDIGTFFNVCKSILKHRAFVEQNESSVVSLYLQTLALSANKSGASKSPPSSQGSSGAGNNGTSTPPKGRIFRPFSTLGNQVMLMVHRSAPDKYFDDMELLGLPTSWRPSIGNDALDATKQAWPEVFAGSKFPTDDPFVKAGGTRKQSQTLIPNTDDANNSRSGGGISNGSRSISSPDDA